MEASRDEREAARRAGYRAGAGRTLAQSFCLVVGLVLVAVGVLGFFFGGSNFGVGGDVQGGEFIVFEVNGWHNVVHLATGAFLLLVAGNPASAATGALAFGLVYGVVTLWGVIDGNDVIGLVPVNAADNWLHLALTVAGVVIGLTAGALGLAGRREREELEERRGPAA